jgi:hypothetical protein
VFCIIYMARPTVLYYSDCYVVPSARTLQRITSASIGLRKNNYAEKLSQICAAGHTHSPLFVSDFLQNLTDSGSFINEFQT